MSLEGYTLSIFTHGFIIGALCAYLVYLVVS